MKKYVTALLVLFTSLVIVGCGNSNQEAENLDESKVDRQEKFINGVEAKREEQKEHEATSETAPSYEEVQGAYALYAGEPYASPITYALILTEDQYIDVVPEWMEYNVFQIDSVDVEKDVITVSYSTEGDGLQQAGSGSMDLKLVEGEPSTLVLSGQDLELYPISQEDLLDQGIQLPEEYFQ